MFTMAYYCMGCHRRRRPKAPKDKTKYRLPKRATIALVGLDKAGKSTLMHGLQRVPVENTLPTLGFVNDEIKFKRCWMTVFDLGGAPKIRKIWKTYYSEIHALVFVVDATARDRFAEARSCLWETRTHEYIEGKPLLLLVNHAFDDDAATEDDVVHALGVTDSVNDPETNIIVQSCNTFDSTPSSLSADIKLGLKKLLSRVRSQSADLLPRRERDMAEHREYMAREQKARQERVRKQREERARLAAERAKKEQSEADDHKPDAQQDAHGDKGGSKSDAADSANNADSSDVGNGRDDERDAPPRDSTHPLSSAQEGQADVSAQESAQPKSTSSTTTATTTTKSKPKRVRRNQVAPS